MIEREDQGRPIERPADDRSTISRGPGPSLDTQQEVNDRVVQRLFGPDVPAVQTIGRYRVLARLGQGSMGTVYLALDPDLDREVAIKVLHRPLDDYYTKRLMREAQAMAKLSHPNVVHVYEVGWAEGRAFVAMEFIKGQTLRQWARRQPPPTWRQCVEVYIQLGQGLAAAHAQGIVHRDFKPSNAIIDDDGRARVLDFGLARHCAAETRDDDKGRGKASSTTDDASTPWPNAEPQANPPTWDTALTAAGTIVGTPAYMPLEQLEGKAVDARSDQFSFCASLYEALYAERPFAGRSIDVLARAKTEGLVQPPSVEPAVPRALYQILRRGLEADPDARWPSMEALMTELRRLAAPPRRWGPGLMLSVGLGALVVGMAYWLGSNAHADSDARCRGASMQLAGIWDQTRRRKVEAAVLGTGLSYAPNTWERVEHQLDEYAAAWTDRYTETCEATTLRGEQSEDAMELRMSCLRDRRASLSARIAVLTRADAQVVEEAVRMVSDLPGLARCDDIERLAEQRRRIAPPEDPQVAQRVELLRSQIEDVDAEQKVGKYARALEHIGPVVHQAEQLGYGPLLATAKLHRGHLYDRSNQYERAEQDLEQAYALAIEHGHDEVASDAARYLGYVVAHGQTRYVEGIQWINTALPLAKRIDDAKRLAMSTSTLGGVFRLKGDYAEAEAQHRRALQLMEREPTADETAVARILSNLGIALYEQGKYEEAEACHRRVVQILERALGANHPDVGLSLNNLGAVLDGQGKYEESEALYRRSLRIWERALGASHPNLIMSLNNLGLALGSQGKHEESEAQLRHALQISEQKLGADHPSVASCLNALGLALQRQGRYDEAKALYRRSLNIREKTLAANHPSAAGTIHNLGLIALHQHEYQEAEAHFGQAIRMLEETLGADHPNTAQCESELGRALHAQGRYEEANTRFRRALQTSEQALGADHPQLTPSLVGLAKVALTQREPEVARTYAERAVSIHEANNAPEPLAEARFLLARALWSDPSQRDLARNLAEQARDALTAHGASHEGPLTEIEAWLAKHGVR